VKSDARYSAAPTISSASPSCWRARTDCENGVRWDHRSLRHTAAEGVKTSGATPSAFAFLPGTYVLLENPSSLFFASALTAIPRPPTLAKSFHAAHARRLPRRFRHSPTPHRPAGFYLRSTAADFTVSQPPPGGVSKIPFRRPVLWCDLADRQKPVALFQLRRSDHFCQIMLGVLWSLRAISGAAVGDATLSWAAEAGWQLSKDGAVGLRALLKTLASPSTRRWFLDTQADPADLGLVFLQGIAMNISVGLQLKLAALDIPVVFAPPVSEPMAVLNPVRTEKSHLRGLQVLRRDDPDMIEAGLDMLAAKVGNQAAVLRYFAKYRVKSNPEVGRTLLDTAEEVSKAAGRIKTLDPSGAEVRWVAMGYEGHAAALYWRRLSLLAPESLEFEGRVTRNASDAVNQCVNYVYGMLYGEVWRAVAKHGLDPYFGFVHGSTRDQGSLVFDMIEELRAPFADRFVFGMLGRGFKPEIGEHGHLRTASKRQLARGSPSAGSPPYLGVHA
jgi:CRISPR-associated endonuclease Cas1